MPLLDAAVAAFADSVIIPRCYHTRGFHKAARTTPARPTFIWWLDYFRTTNVNVVQQ